MAQMKTSLINLLEGNIIESEGSAIVKCVRGQPNIALLVVLPS